MRKTEIGSDGSSYIEEKGIRRYKILEYTDRNGQVWEKFYGYEDCNSAEEATRQYLKRHLGHRIIDTLPKGARDIVMSVATDELDSIFDDLRNSLVGRGKSTLSILPMPDF